MYMIWFHVIMVTHLSHVYLYPWMLGCGIFFWFEQKVTWKSLRYGLQGSVAVWTYFVSRGAGRWYFLWSSILHIQSLLQFATKPTIYCICIHWWPYAPRPPSNRPRNGWVMSVWVMFSRSNLSSTIVQLLIRSITRYRPANFLIMTFGRFQHLGIRPWILEMKTINSWQHVPRPAPNYNPPAQCHW